VRKADTERLMKRYVGTVPIGPQESRIGPALGIDFGPVTELANSIEADLDLSKYGIGWWTEYSALDRQTRILISDYLLACADAIPQNLIEAECSKLELDHSIEDFRKWIERGSSAKNFKIPPPRSLYDDLSYYRMTAHLGSVFRSFASALDCLAGCVVGVAGLPTGIVRTDLRVAKSHLSKAAQRHERLVALDALLEEIEVGSGPDGWLDWLLNMRNMLVHRGRRIISMSITRGRCGIVEDFILILPKSPELTEVDAWVRAGSYTRTQLHVSHKAFLQSLSASVYAYVDGAVKALSELWCERRADPHLLEQPANQWRTSQEIIRPPVFNGYTDLAEPRFPMTELGVTNSVERRLKAAGLTDRRADDVGPSPYVWHSGF
jgi:hypothetical protein